MTITGPRPLGRGLLRRAAARRTLAAVLVAGAAAAVWCGCTVTKENYATLSFFFDGVPDPSAAIAGGDPGDQTIAAAVVVHQPFAEEKCEECHKTQYRPSRNDPRSCLGCHDKVVGQHAWTHGAVAGGACLWCHSPHESVRKWLLRGPDRKLCMQCHSATMLTGKTVPAHADEKASCLSCHFGHGGESPLMLRPGASAAAPPPENATQDDPKKQPVFDPDRRPSGAQPGVGPEAKPADDGAPVDDGVTPANLSPAEAPKPT